MVLTGYSFAFDWEVQLMAWLQANLGSGITPVLSFFSAFGEELVLIVVMGFLFWCYNKDMGKRAGLNVLVGLVWNPMVKNVALRRRPYFDHDEISILRVVAPDADPMNIAAQGYSFPSGHSTNAAAAYGSVAVLLKKRWAYALAALLCLLVGFSRVFVGAHYPTDVIVGWLLGFACILIVSVLRKICRNELVLYGILLATAIPGVFFCRSEDYFDGLGLLVGFIAGCLFEDRFVHFENTRNPLRCVLRILGGALLFFGVNKLLKLPFSSEFLAGGTLPALLVRALRYAVIAFLEFGVYPILFRYTAKIGTKSSEAKQ